MNGRLALVTGSSRGLGAAFAAGLAQGGARVVLHGRDQAALAAQVEAFASRGTPVAGTLCFDVTDAAAVEAGLASLAAAHGPLGILVNNAGIILRKPTLETTDAEWERVMEVDLTACFRLSRAAIRQMVPVGWGRVVMVSSVMGAVARPTIASYVTAKHALVGLVRALAVEFASSGVTVNAIGPGYFPSEANATLRADPAFNGWVSARTPAGRWGQPEELQAAANFFASEGASYVTGQLLMVDGGMTAAL